MTTYSMRAPLFIKGQMVVISHTQNEELLGLCCEVTGVMRPNTCLWQGEPNKEHIYSFHHNGKDYGAKESQLRPFVKNSKACGKSLDELIHHLNGMLK